ncbi:MAG: ABC transporter ATP-binding protein [bacterium]
MSADASSLALRCSNLDYRYPLGLGPASGVTGSDEYGPLALRSIDLEVARGEMVVLAGLSGSGKTTLLRAACGLVPHFHGGYISGALEVAGHDVRSHGPAELATEVGLVAQDPESQVVSTTVLAELRLPLELRGAPEAEVARAVEEVALALGIDHLLERQTGTLSGGELQRVALAAAMVTRPALLLLDEATSQLDPVAAEGLMWALRRLNEEFGVAIICCEHRLERCLEGADRAIAMRSGGIAFDGDPDDFLEWSLDEEPDLATPGAHALRAVGSPAVVSRRKARLALAGAFSPESVDKATGRARQSGTSVARARTALSMRGVEVSLDQGGGEVQALRGLDLELLEGERVALMGANGAGKTTLLRVAAELIENSEGSVLRGERGVAMLPQRPADMIVRERVGDELPRPAGRAALDAVGLEGFEDADPRDLSGGERQRLAVALVIAGRSGARDTLPSALLLDEPTRGMDRGRKANLSALASEITGGGCAVLVATHDVEFAAGFADRVVLLARGRVIAEGPVREVLSSGLHFATEVSRLTDGAALTPEDLLLERDRSASPTASKGLL